jgi:hypothetical protein
MAPVTTREGTSRALDLACKRSRALDRACVRGAAGRLGILPVKGLAEALLDGAMDDFTSADLTYASLAGTDLTGPVPGLNSVPGSVSSPKPRACGVHSEDIENRTPDNGGSGAAAVVTRGSM